MPTRIDNTSLETILTIDNRPSESEWSVVWSTEHVPVMDRGTGTNLNRAERLVKGRRRLRFGALALGGLLTMHCRVTATILTGGFFVGVLMVTAAVALLANPMRHFEVYLGQWSISGPGRAFRIIPAFDGIGIAICANALMRAILCATIAAIAAVYVWHAISDNKLPFTYCRNYKLEPYDPIIKSVASLIMRKRSNGPDGATVFLEETTIRTVGTKPLAWRNITHHRRQNKDPPPVTASPMKQIKVCEETFSSTYPPLYRTPAYNYFYVELMRLRPDYSMKDINFHLIAAIVTVYLVLWAVMIYERYKYKREASAYLATTLGLTVCSMATGTAGGAVSMPCTAAAVTAVDVWTWFIQSGSSFLRKQIIFNNTWSVFFCLPWIWSLCILAVSINLYVMKTKPFKRMLRLSSSAKPITGTISDVLQVSLYLHSASTGSAILLGKGLNYYASGHIDSKLNNENVWHSATLLLLTTLSSSGASLCALIDHYEHKNEMFKHIYESTLWTLPMYSTCTSNGAYSHFWTALIFILLTVSYMVVAFDHLKTALHTIFEYRVKLVFMEQLVVGSTILGCMWCSFLFATNGGIPALESIEAMITGVATPLICLLELAGLLYAYGGGDFVSDMNVATEENTCATRLSLQWQIIPVVVLVTLIMKIISVAMMEMPITYIYIAIVPLLVVVLTVPVRSLYNAYVFLRRLPRQGT